MSSQFEAHSRAMRVLFHFEGTAVRVGATQLVVMTAPPSDVIPRDERPGEPPELAGFWFDLVDRAGRVVYRRGMDNPLLQSATIHTGDPDQPFTNVRLSEAKGEFLLLMPDLPAA